MPVVIKLFRVVTSLKELPPINWHDNSIGGMVLRGHVTNKIHITTYRKPMNTKLDKVLTYCEKLPPLKPNEPLIT